MPINGTTGDDILNGTAGDDTINGLEGNDVIHAGAGNDTVLGGDGIDFIYAAADGSNDSYDGGLNVGGRDRVDYGAALAGIDVNLSLASDQAKSVSGTSSGIGVDQLTNIESVYGSAFGDVLTGNASGNGLYGRDGDDILSGGDGNDTLSGGAGNDTLDGGSGFNVADYSAASGPLHISLATVGPQDTGEGTDTL